MDFITADEKSQLQEKLDDMKAKRPVLSKRIGEARALGDLSENAEYHAAREEQGLLEAEIRRIEQRLKSSKVADDAIIPDDMAFLSSVVTLRDVETGDEEIYKLVGEASGKFDPDAEQIEVTLGSPIGEALMKTRVGDTIKVDLPRGTKRFEVVRIE